MEAKYLYIIVEDDELIVRLLKEYLSDMKELEVVAVHADTINAARDIEKLKPDIVFLDINISGLEGPEFMELVDHKPQIIMISGYPPHVMDKYEVEITDYIQKPFEREQLKASVAKCIAQINR